MARSSRWRARTAVRSSGPDRVGRIAAWTASPSSSAFGLHLVGTLYGTHQHVLPAEAIAWASYNLLVYAVVPLVFFRRRYSAEALNLKSADRHGDTVLIVAVLAIESLFQVFALRPGLLDLNGRQLLLGATVTFVLYLAGAVLPAMVFIYAILVPRHLRLTGSTAGTVILGGLTYTLLHIWVPGRCSRRRATRCFP